MKYGEELEFTVDRLDQKGRGCGTLVDPQRFGAEGRTVCVHGVIPGERVRGNFVGKKKGVFRAGDITILEPSTDRQEPACPHANDCGGCSLQHIAYERQAALKLESLNRTLGFRNLPVKIEEIEKAESLLHHRNRMDYVFGPDSKLSLKKPGRWNAYVSLTTCLMLSEEAPKILEIVNAWAEKHSLEPWDAKRHTGFLRYLVIREGKATGQRLVMLVTSEGELAGEKELVESLKPHATSIYHGINPSITDLSTAEELRLLHGNAFLEERVGDITYAIHPNSFFQTNTVMAGKLLEHVRSLIKNGRHEKLLDLYCGSGFFALALARDCKEVLGIELDSRAIELAGQNAKTNNVKNARFKAEAAEALSWSTEQPDVVIVDPPRSGLHPKVTATLLQHLPPRIVYVSCGPIALARDLEALGTSYDIASAKAFDLFPQTPHIETVIHLIKRTS